MGVERRKKVVCGVPKTHFSVCGCLENAINFVGGSKTHFFKWRSRKCHFLEYKVSKFCILGFSKMPFLYDGVSKMQFCCMGVSKCPAHKKCIFQIPIHGIQVWDRKNGCLTGIRPKCLSKCRPVPGGLVTVVSLGSQQEGLRLPPIVKIRNALSNMT